MLVGFGGANWDMLGLRIAYNLLLFLAFGIFWDVLGMQYGAQGRKNPNSLWAVCPLRASR